MAATDYRSYGNLITAAEVVSSAMTNANLDTSLISSNSVLIAEIAHMKEVLGGYFWGELRKGLDGDSLDTNETALLNNYIKPCLALYVKYEVINDMQYNTTSIGIVTNEDEFSIPADESELSTVKEDTYRKAEILKRDLDSWLNDSNNKGVWVKYESSLNSKGSDSARRIGGIITY